MKQQSGFTLIEVIASIILLGIVSAVAGLGMVNGVRGFVFARENAELSQKAQIAMERIRREVMSLSSVSSPADGANGTSMVFETPSGSRTIGLDTDAVRLVVGSGGLTTGNILVDNVVSFFVARQDATTVGNSTLITIRLELGHQSGETSVEVETRVNARNTEMLNAPIG